MKLERWAHFLQNGEIHPRILAANHIKWSSYRFAITILQLQDSTACESPQETRLPGLVPSYCPTTISPLDTALSGGAVPQLLQIQIQFSLILMERTLQTWPASPGPRAFPRAKTLTHLKPCPRPCCRLWWEGQSWSQQGTRDMTRNGCGDLSSTQERNPRKHQTQLF